MTRRRWLAALLLSGCAEDPVGDYLFGFGDPVRGAALQAPRNLGDTSQWRGNPAGAALAVAQLEFLADSLATDPRYAAQVDPAVTLQLAAARGELREAVGIAPAAAPPQVMAALRRAAAMLQAGSPAAAEAALTGPDFPAGPRRTLARLAALPSLPRTAEAAAAVAAEIGRLDRRR